MIDISTLITLPYNVDGGDSIYAKVSASNVYGESDQSVDGNGAYYTRVPDAPVSLTEDISVRTYTTDGITWTDGTNSGGVPIIDYRINQRELGGNYLEIASGITTQSYTIPDLVLGTTYEFTLESRNSVGFSSISESLSILHAIAPE